MGIKFSNNAETTLAAGIDGSQLTIQVAATALFPTITGASDYFWATIIKQDGTREVVKATDLNGSTYDVVRAQDGTSGVSFITGDKFQIRFPKVVLEDFRDDIDVNTTDLAGTTNSASVPAPAGTRMWFYNPAAPSQWTIYSTVEDCLLGVQGGSGHYNVAGGTGVEVGSWTPTAHVHTMNSHTHTLAHTHGQAAHLHNQTQHQHTGPNHNHTGPLHSHSTPSHAHKWYNFISITGDASADGAFGATLKQIYAPGFPTQFAGAYYSPSRDLYTDTSGGSNTGTDGTGTTSSAGTGLTAYSAVVNTGLTDAGSTNSQSSSTTSNVDPGDTNTGSAPSTDRPLAAVGIIATKD